MAMGNPLSPILAEIVLDDLIDEAVSSISFPIPYIKKYVDDLFLILPQEGVDEIKEVFNKQHSNIQFTVELEKDFKLPFLDLMLHRTNDSKINTEWYIKPIASGRFLNFHSFHALHQKMNVAYNFAKRVVTFSGCKDKKEVNKIIKSHLLLNDYPISLINRILNRMNEKEQSIDTAMVENEIDEEHKTHIFRSLTNIDGLTTQIIKTLRSDYPNIRTASKQKKTIGVLLPVVKDKTPKEEHTNVVYKIQCRGENTEENSCKACYIGYTKTQLKQRMSKHKSLTTELRKLKERGFTKEDRAIEELREKTALINHEVEENHTFDLDGVKIIDRGTRVDKLKVLESCHIKSTRNTVNKRTDTDNIHASYAGIFASLENIRKPKQKTQNSENRTQM